MPTKKISVLLACLLGSCCKPGVQPAAVKPVIAPPVITGPAVDTPHIPVASPGVPPPSVDGRLPTGVTPLHYALELSIDPAQPTFRGKAQIKVRIDTPTRGLVLHGRKMNIISAEVTTPKGKQLAAATLRMAAGGKEDPEELTLELKEPVSGEVGLTIDYDAPFDEQLRGLYRVKEGEHWYAFTQMEPNDARRAFPCFDEPGFKVPFHVIIHAPAGQLALSNSPVDQVSPSRPLSSHLFHETPPLPTYLVAFAVGPFDVLEGPKTGLPVRVVTTKGRAALGQEALDATLAFLKTLDDYFGRPYPYAKLDLVAVPEFSAGAMENAGLITFRDERLLLEAKTSSINARRGMGYIIAHELAHQWFGNLVTMAWWDDLWLNEGFATWMEAKVVDKWRPEYRAHLATLPGKAWIMDGDALDSSKAVRQPITSTSQALEAFDWFTYGKGAAVLAMLEEYVGEDKFKAGVRAYLNAHEWKSATATDLFRALDEAAPGTRIGEVARSFLDQPGVPLLDFGTPTCDDPAQPKQTRVKVSQSRFHMSHAHSADDGARWKVPVCVRYSANGKQNKVACGVLDGDSMHLSLEAPACKVAWLYPNATEAGYYRWRLPEAMTAQLANAAGAKQLASPARWGLINNSWALVQAGQVGADVMLGLVAKMGNEDDRIVFRAIERVLSDTRHAMITPDLHPAYAKFVGKLLGPMGKKLGWDAKKTDDYDSRMMRQSLIDLLGGLAKDPTTLAEADKRLTKWLADPAALDPDVAGQAVTLGARSADQKRFDALRALVKSAKSPEVRTLALRGLGNVSDPALVKAALALSLSEETRLSDLGYIFGPIVGRVETLPLGWAWVKENWEAIRARVGGFGIDRVVGVTYSFCTQAERDEAAAFFGPKVATIEGSERTLKESLAEVDLCIAQRAREAPRVRAFLAKQK